MKGTLDYFALNHYTALCAPSEASAPCVSGILEAAHERPACDCPSPCARAVRQHHKLQRMS